MTGEELYEQNRIFYAEDWRMDLRPWGDLNPEDRFAWEVCATEYVTKSIVDSEDDNGS